MDVNEQILVDRCAKAVWFGVHARMNEKKPIPFSLRWELLSAILMKQSNSK